MPESVVCAGWNRSLLYSDGSYQCEILFYTITNPNFSPPPPLSLEITVKEYLCPQQHTKGSRQWYQEEEAYQARFYSWNGP